MIISPIMDCFFIGIQIRPTQMSHKDPTQKVSGIILWTNNLENLRNFYEQLLGLKPHSIRDKFIAYKWGDLRFSIGTHSKIEGANCDPYRIMINFDTTDIQSVFETLTMNKVECIRKPELEHWGGTVATFRDPDGNIIQFLQQPKSRC
ncbi:MAG: hypothetical protein CL781_03325 [Chloroflexi bacterium]|nr:hypothetical protein [Chloroflexota bacterium]